jgi:uncharacterized cupin superfamily protein
MTRPTLIRLDTLPAPETYRLPAEKLIEGDPLQTLWMQHTDTSGQFFTGLWRSEPGTWRIAYTEEEFCHVLEGRSIVTDAEGQAFTVAAGDQFVMPRGFVGTWQVLETTTKRFVIYEARAEE